MPDLESPRPDLPIVLFLCTHNAGRSQMALGWFNHLADERAAMPVPSSRASATKTGTSTTPQASRSTRSGRSGTRSNAGSVPSSPSSRSPPPAEHPRQIEDRRDCGWSMSCPSRSRPSRARLASSAATMTCRAVAWSCARLPASERAVRVSSSVCQSSGAR